MPPKSQTTVSWRADDPPARVVMGTGGIGPTAHDGEVDLPVTFGEQQSADVGGHLGFGPTNQGDTTGLQHGGDPIGRGTGGP